MIHAYLRVSSKKQKLHGFGLPSQKEAIRNYIETTLDKCSVKYYAEKAVSGTIPFNERPQGGAIIDALKPSDIVIAFDVSRFGRLSLTCQLAYKSITDKDCILATAKNGLVKNSSDKFMFDMMAGMAEQERSNFLERAAAGIKIKKEGGGNIGGGIPFYLMANPEKGEQYLPTAEGMETLKIMINYFSSPKTTAAVFAESIGKSAPFVSKHKKLFNDGVLLAEYEKYRELTADAKKD